MQEEKIRILIEAVDKASKEMMKTSISFWLAVIFVSFFGGALAGFFFLEFAFGVEFDVKRSSDPVAIANTYIVFVTFLFVILTVILAFVSLHF